MDGNYFLIMLMPLDRQASVYLAGVSRTGVTVNITMQMTSLTIFVLWLYRFSVLHWDSKQYQSYTILYKLYL